VRSKRSTSLGYGKKVKIDQLNVKTPGFYEVNYAKHFRLTNGFSISKGRNVTLLVIQKEIKFGNIF
jgi:hypothetical protein